MIISGTLLVSILVPFALTLITFTFYLSGRLTKIASSIDLMEQALMNSIKDMLLIERRDIDKRFAAAAKEFYGDLQKVKDDLNKTNKDLVDIQHDYEIMQKDILAIKEIYQDLKKIRKGEGKL